MSDRAWGLGLRAWGLANVLAVLRRVVGMPDYDSYVRHVRACHPERPVPSEREFFDEYIRVKYQGGAMRCC